MTPEEIRLLAREMVAQMKADGPGITGAAPVSGFGPLCPTHFVLTCPAHGVLACPSYWVAGPCVHIPSACCDLGGPVMSWEIVREISPAELTTITTATATANEAMAKVAARTVAKTAAAAQAAAVSAGKAKTR